MKKNTITYYIIPTERFGHGAVQFGNGNILGKYPDLGKPREGDKVGKNLVDDRDEVDIEGVVKVTVSYPDSKQYNAAKEKYEKDAGSYWPIGENCIDYLNNVHLDAGGQGTIGMQFSLEQINNMGGSLASNYMKSKYGYKELIEISKLLPNQESAIEKQYNLPPGSVKFSGTKYKASESGDHIEFQYKINNPINSQEKPKITEEDVSDRLEELNKAGAEAIEIADSVLAADGANNAEKFHNAARGFEGDEPGVASVLHGLGDDTAMVDFLADFALKNYGEESKEISEEGEL